MKKIVYSLLVILVAMAGCKSSRKAATGPYTPPVQQTGIPAVPPKVFTMPEAPAPAQVTQEEAAVPVRYEAITFPQPQDQTTNNYFVIVGSFSYMENASKFRQTLASAGFKPIIVQSETGFYRVTVDSFSNEADARKRLLQIRQEYPQYADTWLLIKQ